MSNELIRRIDEILDEVSVPERHTFFQLKHFIIGKEPTIQAQQWQVIRELRARRESLEALQEQIEDLADNIQLSHIKVATLEDKLTNSSNGVKQAKLQIYLNKAKRQMRGLYRA